MGPHEYTTVDGTFSEAIVRTIEHISGAPLNRLQISYYGDDRRLSWPRVLTLADTRSVLQKWVTDLPSSIGFTAISLTDRVFGKEGIACFQR